MLSADLIREPCNQRDPLRDLIFCSAKKIAISPDTGDVTIQIGDAPIVVANKKVHVDNSFSDVFTVDEVRSGKTPYTLLSGGAFLRCLFPKKGGGTELKLAVLQRDGGAPQDKGFYTGPAGRCGEPLGYNCVEETNEEVIISSNGEILAFFGCGISEEAAITMKTHQFPSRFGYRSIFVKTIAVDPYKPIPGMKKITTKIGEEVVDIVYGLAFMDEAVRTLEVRVPIEVELASGAAIVDGEAFGRNAAFYTPDELSKLPMVYALKEYVKSLTH